MSAALHPSLIAAAIHAHVTGTDAVVGARVGEVAQTWNAYRRGRIRPGEAKIAEWCRKAGLSVTVLPDGSVRVDGAPLAVMEVVDAGTLEGGAEVGVVLRGTEADVRAIAPHLWRKVAVSGVPS